MVNRLFILNVVLFITICTFIILAATGAFSWTKVYAGEDDGLLTYGIQSGVEFVPGISYYGEVETWLGTTRDSFRGWQIQQVEYTLEFTYDNFTIGHQCQHYLNQIDDWDSQNYFNIKLDLPDNTDRRK